eukprot:8726686-Pyramimonas_sp.AAC.1
MGDAARCGARFSSHRCRRGIDDATRSSDPICSDSIWEAATLATPTPAGPVDAGVSHTPAV